MPIFSDDAGRTQAYHAVLESFMRAKAAAREAWASDMEERTQYYNGLQRDILEREIAQFYPVVVEKMKPFVFINFYRKLINAMSMVYSEAATRELVGGSDADSQLLEKLYTDSQFNRKIKQAERWTVMYQTAFAQWRYNETDDQMELDLIEPQRVEVVQDEFDPASLEAARAIILQLLARTDTMGDRRLLFQFWSAGAHPLGDTARSFLFDQDRRIMDWPESYANPEGLNKLVNPVTGLPIYPLVKFDFEDSPEFFGVGGDDVLAVCKKLDHLLIDLCYGAKMQAFSIPVITSGPVKDKPDKVVFDPGVASWFESMGGDVPTTFSFVTPDPKLDTLLNLIKSLFQLAGKVKDADPSAIRLDDPAGVESGFAKFMEKSAAISARKDRLEYWRVNEQRLARKMMILWNLFHPGKAGFSQEAIEGGIRVDFADPTPEMDPMQKLELERFEQEDGLISLVDRYMKRNPDLTHEEAMEKLKAIKKENQELSGEQEKQQARIDGFKQAMQTAKNPDMQKMVGEKVGAIEKEEIEEEPTE